MTINEFSATIRLITEYKILHGDSGPAWTLADDAEREIRSALKFIGSVGFPATSAKPGQEPANAGIGLNDRIELQPDSPGPGASV